MSHLIPVRRGSLSATGWYTPSLSLYPGLTLFTQQPGGFLSVSGSDPVSSTDMAADALLPQFLSLNKNQVHV